MNVLKVIGCSMALCALPLSGQTGGGTELFRDMKAPQHERIMDLLSRLTVEEKISLLVNDAPAIGRLGIDKYNHGNEALHGVVRPGDFTVFPQAIGMAAMWNPELLYRISSAISDEARGRWKELEYGKKQIAGASDLLTFWSPTVNMARDPRWGRTPETYGEDPYLSGVLGVAFVKGLQGDHPRYLKTVSTPKHFAVNNEEHNRSSCNAKVSERDLREYYLPSFERCITEGKAQSIMMAYNAVNDVPCTVNTYLIKNVLRGDWGFNGYIVSDCSAPEWMITKHHYVKTREAAATLAVKAGLDLECGNQVYGEGLLKAYRQYMVSEADIDSAAYRILRGRMMLGLFDDPSQNPYNQIEPSVVGCKAHQDLALEAARQSMVLLKNKDNFLPLNPKKVKSIAVVGISAGHCEFGDYSGTPKNEPVTILDGIKQYAEEYGFKVAYAPWVSASEDFEPVTKTYFPEGLKVEYYRNNSLSGEASVRMEEELLYDPVHKPDRFQPEGKICIYVFIPNTSKQTYNYEAMEQQEIIRLAQIHSLKETWKDENTVAEALQRLKEAINHKPQERRVVDFEFVIDDNTTYYLLSDFQAPKAKQLFQSYRQLEKDYLQQEDKLDGLRQQYATANQQGKEKLAPAILDLEKMILQMNVELDALGVSVRNAEKTKSK